MPIYDVQAPDGKVYSVEAPEGTPQDQIFGFVRSQMGQATQPQEGITAALTGGFKRFLSTGETALESLIDPELAAKRGVERSQRIGEQYAPGASLEKVKQAYAERGLFPAVGEAVSQIPAALAEQAPQIAATLGSAKLGAMAGTAVAPGPGTLFGGLAGAVAPSLMQLYGSNIERQAQENVPEISRAGALAAAAPGAALEVASTFIPLGRNLIGKLLGPNAEKALARGSNEAIERRAQEALTTTLLKGTAVGAAVEIPTEVTQQMLERFQAGLPLTTEDALKEYGEAAYGAGLVGGPFGAGARALGRPAARAEYERVQQEEAARLAVPEEELEQRFPDVLPGGFKIEREELGREMGPEGYSIMAEGREEPLSVVDTQEEADAKLASLTKLRAEERDNLLKEEEKINADVQKARDKLERLEATEQTDTDEYRTLKAEFPAMMDESAQKIKDTYDKVETLSKPLTITPFGEVERVNEQFKLFGPDAKEVGAFKTREQAEGVVEQAVGEDTFKQTKANRETARQLYKTFVPQMRKFGLGDVGLEIVDKIENGAGGAYLNKLIKVSLEDATPLQTMRHEAVHALKDLGFFTPQQWNVLSDRAKKTWIEDLKKTPYEGDKTRYDAYVEMFTKEGKDKALEGEALNQYVNDSLIEESVADAFGAYDKGAKPPPGMIAALVRKLKDFFAKLSQALRGSGFQSADDIFQQIERGGLKPAAKAEPKTEAEEKQPAKSSLRSLTPVTLDTRAGRSNKSYASEYVAPAQNAVATGNSKVVTLKDGTKVNLVLGSDKTDNQRGAIVALNDEGEDVGHISFYKSEDEYGNRYAPDVNVSQEFRRKGLATALYDAAEENGALIPDLKAAKQFRTEEGQAFREARAKAKEGKKFSLKPSTWKATKADAKQADEYFDENGVMPYISEGQIDVPLDAVGAKYSIKKPYDQKAMAKDQTLKNDPLTGLPMNANGTVTLYFPTDNVGARDLAKTKRLKGGSPTANRIYLTNESSASAVQANPGLIDQPLGGANVLLQVDPSLLHVLDERPDGRKDFFIPIAEGEYFAKKMAQTKLFTLNAPRTKGLHPDRTLSQVTKMVNDTADKWAKATKAERAKMAQEAKALLREQHNIEKLFGANAKLEKTNIGEYGLTYKGKKVMSTGLGFASAQKINDEQRATTCPQSAICESLCLGETSGQNLLYGGEGEFRSGPRLSQFLKTEALIVNPEAFAVALIKQIETFRNAAKRLGYQPAIRLNVTSDFNPKTFENVINMFPDVMFYDYTKLDTKPIAPNHHLTYSSTGASQVVNGETIVNEQSNWDRMVDKVLAGGRNVAMAFTSRTDMPKAIFDERTGKTFQVWNGDEYDARFLDPVREDGVGMIVGLTNKDRTTSPEDAAKKHNGFFLNYDKARDGDTLVIRDQNKLAGKPSGKVIPIAKLSFKAPTSPEFKQWFGDSKVVNKDGTPKVMYHGTARDITEFRPKQASAIFVTDNPDVAASYSQESEQWMADHADEFLTPDQKQEVIKNTKKLLRANGYRAAQINALEADQGILKTDEFREAVAAYMPSGPNVMPLYVRAEKIFDFDNPKHVQSVVEKIPDLNPDDFNRTNNWTTVEDPKVQAAIKAMGFDSFYVNEHGIKNLAVYEPNQVKSATGNVGTFSRTSPNIRYSLLSFSTVKEAQKAADDTPVPDTAEFKRYIAGSQWVDEEGKAKKFFHATTSNFFEFKDGVIYLSESAADSEKFGLADEDRLRASIYRALNKDEKMPLFQRAVDKAVEAGKISAEKGETFMRDAKRKVPDFGKYNAIKEEMDAELIALAPERMKIMPLYARAMTPFDFRNPDHVDQVLRHIEQNFEYYRNPSERVKQEARERGFPTAYPDDWLKGLRGLLVQGYETTIEQPPVQNALRRLGFDGYVMRKNRTAPLNYAIYKPQQAKSITGNDGDFSLETKDIRYSLKSVRYTPERFDALVDESMYLQGGQENKTKGYLAFVNPLDFVKATASKDDFARVQAEQELLDFEKMGELGAPRLDVSIRNGQWKIVGHEGRHRMLSMHDAGYRDVPVHIKFATAIDDAKPLPVKMLKAQFDDSLNSILMAGEVEPLSYENGPKVKEKFTEADSVVKFSLPRLSDTANNRIREVSPGRIELGFKDRVIGLFKQDFTGLRQSFLNGYEILSVYDRAVRQKIKAAGGPDLLADQSAEFAALQSDLSAGVAASAIGLGDRQGGIPVYRNGLTTIDTSVKGLGEALAPLARQGKPEKGQPDIYSQYQFWAGWKRARRMLREGREELYTLADIRVAQEIEAAHPEFIDVQKDLIAFNNGIVNYAVQTGVLSRERARVYTQYADYIPFYRQLELDKTIGPNPFSGISGQRGPRELKGGDAPLADFLETMVRNTQSMINAGMKNIAAQRATKIALEINQVERLPRPAAGIGVDVYTVLENGQLVYYRANDKLFIDALASLNMPDLPFLGLLSAPANVLRNLVTKDPGFMMANLLRDSLSSYVTSGQNVTPVVGTVVNYAKALSGKDKVLQALFNAGVVSSYEFSQNIQQSGKTLTADLNKKAGQDAVLLRPFKSLWQGLEKGTTASDAATRMAIYERVMQETGNEAEAISRALEVMNFNRKGNNVMIRIATAALPFFNARLQGLDLFYRAARGRMNTQDAAEIKKRFWVRGATMMALSAMYYLSVAGDDEYERQEEETKDNNWIIPFLGIRIPIPFEVGTLFKTIPERILAYTMGNDTGKDLGASTLRALANTFAFNPIPQTFKPIIEVATNFNFFTMRPIVGQGMQDVAPQFQVGPGTSKTAETIGGMINVSPMKVDQLIKGYTGTMGGYLVDVIDSITNEFSDIPKASKRFEQLPVVKRFALDPEARGSVTQFYEMQKSVDTFVRTANLLEKTARPEEYVKYVQDNLGLLAAKDYISSIEKEMTKLRDTKRIINSSDMPPDEKRDLLVDLGRLENNLTANIKTAKRAFSELK